METVELRPLSLGELLDRTFRLYRNHFLLFVSIMAMPAAFSIPFNALILGYQGSFMNGMIVKPGQPPVLPSLPSLGLIMGIVLGYVVFVIVFGSVYSIAVAAATSAVADVYLGRTATVRGAYGRIRGKFWKLMGTFLNVAARVAGLLLAVVAFAIGSAVEISRNGGVAANVGIVLLLFFVLFIAYTGALVLAVFLALRYALWIPVLMLENVGVLATIRRTVLLTRGRCGQIFLTLLVAAVIAFAGSFIFQFPFVIANMMATMRGHGPSWLAFATSISGAIGSTLTGPISMIAIVLLYYDSRIRKEAFDLQFMMASLDNPAPAAGTVSPA
jgi:hypothetical protein